MIGRARASKPATTTITCLGPCGKSFASRDPRTNRVCPKCQARNDNLSRRDNAPHRSGGLGHDEVYGD